MKIPKGIVIIYGKNSHGNYFKAFRQIGIFIEIMLTFLGNLYQWMIFLIWVLRPFQEYFTYIEPIVHRRWAKTGEPGEKPPDHP